MYIIFKIYNSEMMGFSKLNFNWTCCNFTPEIHGQITINYQETVCCVVSPNSWVVCQPIMRGCESVNR